jgi:hypothetical protein
MAILTKEQKVKYLADGAGACPFCGCANIIGEGVEISGMECWQDVFCSRCRETWRDVYKLAFVETDDEHEEEPKTAKSV